MGGCENCGRVVHDPDPILPLCHRCLSELGIDAMIRGYLHGLSESAEEPRLDPGESSARDE